MRPRNRVAAVAAGVAAAVLSPLTTSPAAAAITSSYFDCGALGLSALPPAYQFTGVGRDLTLWWVPQYYVYDGAQWRQHAGGEYQYNLQGGAPHAWQRYPDGSPGGTTGLSRVPSGYYAVLNWVYAEGQWHSAWAQNSDQVNGPKPEDLYWCRA